MDVTGDDYKSFLSYNIMTGMDPDPNIFNKLRNATGTVTRKIYPFDSFAFNSNGDWEIWKYIMEGQSKPQEMSSESYKTLPNSRWYSESRLLLKIKMVK